MNEGCLLCNAERVTDWHLEDEECWVADCVVCMTPMIVWRTHGLPDAELEAALLSRLERVAAARYGDEGYYIDDERRRIPDHWHAHARPTGGFFDPKSELYGRFDRGGGEGAGGDRMPGPDGLRGPADAPTAGRKAIPGASRRCDKDGFIRL